jgi:hypothetical protein
VPKFEPYKHNDELFNIYCRIFYERWTFAYFDRLCKLEKRGDEIKKKFFSSETSVPISTKLCWDDPWVVPFQNCVCQSRPVSKMAALHCDEWDRVVALPRHKFVTGATLLQLVKIGKSSKFIKNPVI